MWDDLNVHFASSRSDLFHVEEVSPEKTVSEAVSAALQDKSHCTEQFILGSCRGSWFCASFYGATFWHWMFGFTSAFSLSDIQWITLPVKEMSLDKLAHLFWFALSENMCISRVINKHILALYKCLNITDHLCGHYQWVANNTIPVPCRTLYMTIF